MIGKRNRFTTVSFAYHYAFGFGCLHRIFYGNQRSSRNNCYCIFDDSAYVAHRHADANSVWRAMVAARYFHLVAFRNFLFRGMVCRKNLPSGYIDVRQKTNVERII